MTHGPYNLVLTPNFLFTLHGRPKQILGRNKVEEAEKMVR